MVFWRDSLIGRSKLLQQLEDEGDESCSTAVLPQVFQMLRMARTFVMPRTERPTPAAGVHVG